ncbi:hypothetical protein SAG0170_10360, partial [Streptococcus agalactiae LDS 617]
MTQFTTELLNFLAQKQDIDEFFRSSLETAMNDLLERLKGQGVQQVSLVVTDGFNGLDQLIQQAFPMAKQQRCLVHIGRNIASKVKRADRALILEQFKTIYRA